MFSVSFIYDFKRKLLIDKYKVFVLMKAVYDGAYHNQLNAVDLLLSKRWYLALYTPFFSVLHFIDCNNVSWLAL